MAKTTKDETTELVVTNDEKPIVEVVDEKTTIDPLKTFGTILNGGILLSEFLENDSVKKFFNGTYSDGEPRSFLDGLYGETKNPNKKKKKKKKDKDKDKKKKKSKKKDKSKNKKKKKKYKYKPMNIYKF